jgi:hypothetical protein
MAREEVRFDVLVAVRTRTTARDIVHGHVAGQVTTAIAEIERNYATGQFS